METMEIIKIALVVIVGYFILKFLWNLVSGIVKLIIVILIVGVCTYFVKPELLHEVIGKENTEELAKKGNEFTNDAKVKLDSLIKEKGKEVVDSVTN